MTIDEAFPLAALAETAPEDLAGPLLSLLVKWEAAGVRLHRGNFGGDCDKAYRDEGRSRLKFLAAWDALDRQGLLTRSHDDFWVVSPSGQEAAKDENFGSFRTAGLLPRALLHPSLTPRTSGAFARGDYPVAVREAMTEVEIAVRNATGYPNDVVGEKLMLRAFAEAEGPLTDRSLPVAERQGMMHVFVGAMKLWRNPPSHRRVPFEPKEAARLVLIASELLTIVDSREPKPDGKPTKAGSGPVITYDLGFGAQTFYLEVRIGNRGHKAFFVSEVWLCKPKRGQAMALFVNHRAADEILANGGRVYKIGLNLEDAATYSVPGSFIEMTDATGRKYIKKLSKKSTEFLNGDWVRKHGLDKPLLPEEVD